MEGVHNMPRKYTKKPAQNRFMAKVFVPNDPDACWEWKAAKRNDGYGQFSLNRKPIGAHIVSYQFFCGEISKGMCVCHKCDNRSCVNPKHLFLGTHKENMADMVRKKRQSDRKGSKNSRAILKEDDILKIRKLFETKLTQTEIGKMFGVSYEVIGMIKRGRNWSHVQ